MRFGRSRRVDVDLSVDADAERRAWPTGARAALSLSFDDARRSQLDVGLSMLDELEVHATFFVLPSGINPARRGWIQVVAAGHEIGNHTARHPCSANFAWSRHHAIEDLTVEDMAREIAEADAYITRTFGVEARSFAYPCGHTFVGRGRETCSFVPLIADRFVAGRTFNDVATNAPTRCDLAQVRAMNSDGLGFEQVRPVLEAVVDEGAWLVLGGHEVGVDGDDETTMPATVAAIVAWCHANDVWIDTISHVADRVRILQQTTQPSRSR